MDKNPNLENYFNIIEDFNKSHYCKLNKFLILEQYKNNISYKILVNSGNSFSCIGQVYENIKIQIFINKKDKNKNNLNNWHKTTPNSKIKYNFIKFLTKNNINYELIENNLISPIYEKI